MITLFWFHDSRLRTTPVVVVVCLCSSALLSPESLLTNLFPDDDGGKAPNPSSLYQLAKVG